MNIDIVPKKVFIGFIFLISFLLLANIVGIIFKFYLGHPNVYGLVALFNFDTEYNVPSLYSFFALVVCSTLLAIIAIVHIRQGSSYIYWIGLAVIFLFLSIDELVSIHEKIIWPVRKLLNTSGLLYYAWIIPYSAALVVFLMTYFRFIINLPKKIMLLFIVAGAIYVLGAIGFEMIGGLQADLYGTDSVTYSLITTSEEYLEMLGVVIFIYALLLYMSFQSNTFTITIIRK